ncbi:hypothetical protein [Rhizobium mongolense]|uniref:hypothetical protein n=1 Tax=Rhizobium mongolense TaxID=57676 RepID=UPI00160AC577|nr:hypothetical protein [Rhizobium mongolense]
MPENLFTTRRFDVPRLLVMPPIHIEAVAAAKRGGNLLLDKLKIRSRQSRRVHIGEQDRDSADVYACTAGSLIRSDGEITEIVGQRQIRRCLCAALKGRLAYI